MERRKEKVGDTTRALSLSHGGSDNNWEKGTSLMVQWLRLHPSTTGAMGSIPGQGSPAHCAGVAKKKKIVIRTFNLSSSPLTDF